MHKVQPKVIDIYKGEFSGKGWEFRMGIVS